MDYEALMDGRQKHVHEHFSPNSKLNDPEFVKKLLDWITFWRRNPSRFVQRYFGITLYLYQHIILYLMDIFPSICIVAARSAAKSFIIAVYACSLVSLHSLDYVVVVKPKKAGGSRKGYRASMDKMTSVLRSMRYKEVTLNSWAETFSNILGIPVYWHSLRHFFTTSLAKANLPDSVIKTIIGWESLEMVDIYKDIDDEDEIGKYCMNGEIVGQKQAALSDL